MKIHRTNERNTTVSFPQDYTKFDAFLGTFLSSSEKLQRKKAINLYKNLTYFGR